MPNYDRVCSARGLHGLSQELPVVDSPQTETAPAVTSSAGRIGIFGGTFDPVHIGHLRTAIELGDALSLECINLLPCHIPAHRDTPGASTGQRIRMLEIAVSGIDGLAIDSREAERETPSYSVDTLQSYRREYPDASLLFFMGMDAFDKFTSWHRWQDILELAHLVVVERPGSTLVGPEAELLESRGIGGVDELDTKAGSILLQRVTQIDVSATRIRQLVSQNRNISYLVTEQVGRYIIDEGLYTSSPA